MTADATLERCRAALRAIRRAAGGAREFTNRMQFIHARAGAALDGLPWSEDWKADNGYKVRDRTMIENDELRTLLRELIESGREAESLTDEDYANGPVGDRVDAAFEAADAWYERDRERRCTSTTTC